MLLPLPVFHFGSEWRHVDAIAEAYEAFALGGIARMLFSDRARVASWLADVFRRVGRRRVHGFGCTAAWALRRHPFHSADSASWNYGSTHADLWLFDGRRFRQVNLYNRTAVAKHLSLLRRYGVDARRALVRGSFGKSDFVRIGVESMRRFSAFLSGAS